MCSLIFSSHFEELNDEAIRLNTLNIPRLKAINRILGHIITTHKKNSHPIKINLYKGSTKHTVESLICGSFK